jgi:nitrate reductase gamma subunit
MASHLDQFIFGIYPYIALSVFFIGSLVRFDRDQQTWKSDSSQLLRRRELRWGSNLFHFGILVVFFGHLFGFLIPEPLVDAVMTPPQHALLAMVGGGIAGVLALAGLTLLMHRRLADPRIHANTRPWDVGVLSILWIQLALGLWTIYFSAQELGGATFARLIEYVQGIVIFRAGNADLLLGVPWVYKAHIALGLTIFLIFPFTRLVHIWSGFATVAFLFRPPQLVRAPGGRNPPRTSFPPPDDKKRAML